MRYLLYNPLSGKGDQAKADAERYEASASMPVKVISVTDVEDTTKFFCGLEECDDVVIFGGDGTLNRIANELDEVTVKNSVLYFPCGTGNDFARDVDAADTKEPIPVNDYIKGLPTVSINGKQHKFINGIGFGIDGYCCEVGDELKRRHKLPNYTAIAIKGLLFHFKPVVATVVVDGQQYEFKKVWIAPSMFGRYYGGGMMPTPNQDRNAEDKKLSLMLFHGSSKLKTLMIFPSIFKGEHVKYKKNITILQGKSISVRFSRPASLQIDGETVLGVTEYSVTV